MWDLPESEIKPVPPTLAGRFFNFIYLFFLPLNHQGCLHPSYYYKSKLIKPEDLYRRHELTSEITSLGIVFRFRIDAKKNPGLLAVVHNLLIFSFNTL